MSFEGIALALAEHISDTQEDNKKADEHFEQQEKERSHELKAGRAAAEEESKREVEREIEAGSSETTSLDIVSSGSSKSSSDSRHDALAKEEHVSEQRRDHDCERYEYDPHDFVPPLRPPPKE